MTLENLLGISLEKVVTDRQLIDRLMTAAARNIQDAEIHSLSNENRFDVAYKAIMQLANVALQAQGYRTLTSKPGHHQVMIQSLPRTCGLEQSQMIVMDAMRKQRNISDYAGDLVTESLVRECIGQAKELKRLVEKKLKDNTRETE
jgi:uncharacterized protein (UPF0332 family)